MGMVAIFTYGLADSTKNFASKECSFHTLTNYDTLIQLVEFFHCSADFLLGIKEYPYEEIDYLPVPPFSQRLRTVLKEMNCTQYSFIKQTKISWGVFYNWLSGKSNPSVDNLVKIASFFDCSVDFILGRVK